jgi:hypothetical protein
MNPSDQSTDQNDNEANWQYKTENSAESNYTASDVSQSTGVPLEEIPSVSWSASEYIAHEKSASWYLALFAASTVLVAFVFLFTRDILASVVIFLACLAIGVYAARKPVTKQYVVDEQGITIDNVLHRYREFRSFSVIEEGAIDSVWLKPLKRFSPVKAIYFSPEDESRIIDVLANFLPHEQKELDVVDRFSKRMRF